MDIGGDDVRARAQLTQDCSVQVFSIGLGAASFLYYSVLAAPCFKWWNIQYSSLNLPKNICQILDSRQECCLVSVLRRHLERIFTYKT